eukprot:TRINITY_DN2913_c0_g1_i1.p1 TRINITY_DN2913_c0_g1~~TRINITY_DN2913_c0_g1_i1.p1  ORF type:complete len:55 (-),score=3.53 TRINITY_DN2913_c0_g1_i1:190-354(-)
MFTVFCETQQHLAHFLNISINNFYKLRNPFIFNFIFQRLLVKENLYCFKGQFTH